MPSWVAEECIVQVRDRVLDDPRSCVSPRGQGVDPALARTHERELGRDHEGVGEHEHKYG